MAKKNKIVWLAQASSGHYDDYAEWFEGVFVTPEAAMIHIDTTYEDEYKLSPWAVDHIVEGVSFVAYTKTKYDYERVNFKILPVELQS